MAHSGPVRLRDQLRRDAAEAILNAAEALIARSGIRGASMQALAREAGVAVGTLYNYFGDREGLLAELVERQRRRLAATIQAAERASESLGFFGQSKAFLSAVIRLFDERRELVRASLDSELWRALSREAGSGGHQHRVREQLDARARSLVELGLAEGALAPVGRERLGAHLGGALRGVILMRARAGEQPSPEEEAEVLLRLFLHGAAAPASRPGGV